MLCRDVQAPSLHATTMEDGNEPARRGTQVAHLGEASSEKNGLGDDVDVQKTRGTK